MSVPSIELNDGNKMPQVGFGLWKVDNKTCAEQVYQAIKAGYRLFDGACGMCFSPSTLELNLLRDDWTAWCPKKPVAKPRIRLRPSPCR